MNIEKLDKNFKNVSAIGREDLEFHSVLNEPFAVHGLIYENGKFRRMPKEAARAVSEGVYSLHTNTAGGRVRFKTDSRYVAISAKMPNICRADHFAFTGTAGFDLYLGEEGKTSYFATFRPPISMTEGYSSVIDLGEVRMRELTLNFPLYSDVSELYIGVDKTAVLENASPYRISGQVVFYGHSITQGGCASRPGNAYPCILSRRLGFDFVNLGFSGNCRGESKMAEYISSLEMRALVLDYDHNAPSVEYLKATHKDFFFTIRKKHPDLPVIMMTTTTMPRYSDDREGRREVVYGTYRDALENGDKNVYFWDGSKEFMPYAEYGTVEGCHPNDHGFLGIADSLYKILKGIV